MKNKFLLRTILLACWMSIFVSGLCAQPSGFLYGVNIINSVKYFAKIDISNSQVTNMDTVPFYTGFNDKISSFMDWDQGIYYYSSGREIAAFDINSGTRLYHVNYSIPAGDFVLGLAYNSCDSTIYGIYDNGGSAKLVNLVPSTGVITAIGSYNLVTYPSIGDGYFIDPGTSTYYFKSGNFLKKVNMQTGQLISSLPIVNLAGEDLTYISWECATAKIYCTTSDATPHRYLSTINKSTGIVSHVSATSFPSGYVYLLTTAGSTVKQTGIYYYGDAYNEIAGVNLQTGVVTQTLGPWPWASVSFELLCAYPQCSCTGATAIHETEDLSTPVTISFDPASVLLTITSNHVGRSNGSIRIINLLGEIFYEEKSFPGKTSVVDLHTFSNGMYIVEVVMDGKKTVEKLIR